MLKLRPKSLLLTALLSCSFTLSAAEDISLIQTDTATDAENTATAGFIRDNLFIYMHAGAGKRFRILGSVNAGTAVEKLEQDSESGFVKIKDDKGRIGWIEDGNFTTESSVKVQLVEMQTQVEQLKQELAENQSVRDQAVMELQSSQQASDDFSKTVAKLEEEKLALQAKIDKLEGDTNQKTLMYGAGILFGGLVFGLILPSMMPRRRRRDNW